jgi:AAA15 family ATPase/GTPase
MEGYFRDEFKKYLEKEYERNKHLKADMNAKKYASEAESMGPLHGTTFQPQIGYITTSFTKSENEDVIKENHIENKHKNLQDTLKSSAPVLESALAFKGASTSPHISTVHPSKYRQKAKEKCCTLTSEVLNNKHKCE